MPAEHLQPDCLTTLATTIRLGDVRSQQPIQAPSRPSHHDARPIRDSDSVWNHPCGKTQEQEEKGGLITRLLAELDCRCSVSPAWDSQISSTTKTEASGRGARSINGTDRVCHLEPESQHGLAILIGLQVMNRDRRLTGFLRGQTANPVAPDGYELNNPWRV